MTAGLFAGLDRQGAARFSFLLSTPVIIGAGILSFKDASETSEEYLSTDVFVVGMVVSALVGYFTIKYMLKFVSSHNYNIFVLYRVLIGVAALLYFF